MVVTEAIASERLEKIARMALFDVPYKQIAHAIGVTEGRVTQLMETEEYKDILEKLAAENFEKHDSMNGAWDTIEAVALNNIMDHLNWSKDADFALKAAAVANRATRRGQINNRAIDGRTGVRAVIHLSAQFVEKLQVNTVHVANGADSPVNGHTNGHTNGIGAKLSLRNRNDRETLKHKDNDFMSPDQVEKIFLIDTNKKNEEDKVFLPHLAAMLQE